MKIGFDVSQTGNNKAGCGFVADALIRALIRTDPENAYLLYPHFGGDFRDPDALKTTTRVEHPRVRRIPVGRNPDEGRIFWEGMTPEKEDALGSPDIIHANNFFCPTGLTRARLLYTLHDISFLMHPEFTTEQNRWICFNGVFRASLHADAIIAVSAFSRESFLEVFPHYPPDRITVVPLGSRFGPDQATGAPSGRSERFHPGEFWLSVGTLEPRKNLRRMLAAYAEYRNGAKDAFPLVLAGGQGWMEEDLEAYIHSLGLQGEVMPLGYVADEELIWLYRNCFAFVYPSLYEGFGLPVLEAMTLGAAVITSHDTSLPEVAGDAALYVDPWDVSDIARAFGRLAADAGLRETLKQRADCQSRKFSWERSAARTLAVYRRLMDET
ncbi:glycosyltransferase family 4 protein [Desulfococcus sp.]|uniref:glycosyltransferase family 4 protein n=1 Tax=Desulfococcus sp. TaxID=2025834 RepID=UPI0035948474